MVSCFPQGVSKVDQILFYLGVFAFRRVPAALDVESWDVGCFSAFGFRRCVVLKEPVPSDVAGEAIDGFVSFIRRSGFFDTVF